MAGCPKNREEARKRHQERDVEGGRKKDGKESKEERGIRENRRIHTFSMSLAFLL